MNTQGTERASEPSGRVEISHQAIVSVVHDAVVSCYGIVDMATRGVRSSIGRKFGLGAAERGIDIAVEGDTLTIDLSVVVLYGTPIFTVATNVMQTVKFRVEDSLGMHVERVNINVDGLRVGDEFGRPA